MTITASAWKWGGYVGVALALALLLAGNLAHKRAVVFRGIDLIAGPTSDYRTINVFPLECNAATTYRWVLGGIAGVRFHAVQPGEAWLSLGLRSPFPGQRIEVLLNGVRVCDLTNADAESQDAALSVESRVALRSGQNEVVFASSAYNGNPQRLLNDDRPLAFMLDRLSIRPW